MTVVGLHPEELFDKLLDGELTSPERDRLRAHLDACEVCRFEYAARLDFQAEALALGPTSPPPLVPLRAPAAAASAAPRRRRSRLLIWGVAAAALITASGAVASVVTGSSPWHVASLMFSRGAQTTLPTDQAAPQLTRDPARPAARAPEQTALAAPAVAATPEQSASDAALPSPNAAPRAARLALRAPAPSHRVTAATPTMPVALPAEEPAKAAKEPATPAKLFAEANQARRAGDIGRASGLYHVLQDQFPGSSEAELSRVTLALLLLDSGDAQGALGGFERYLAGASRGLEAEALVGRARALGRLGRRDLEATAWREVQRKYPRSIYGRQATERLAALGQP